MSRAMCLFMHVFVLALLAGSGPLFAQAPSSEPGSAALRVMSAVKLTLRDGAHISLDIYRPAQAGRYPTLYAAGPFPATQGAAPDTAATGPVALLVNQDYNYVIASVRGTGGSAGSFGFLSREEQQDHYEIIEWIATQDWSDGQVAGIGAGYAGTSQWYMAIQNPPHLRCVAPVNAITDPYRQWAWPGGLANPEFIEWYEHEVRDTHAWPERGAPRHIELDLRLEQRRHPLLDGYWSIRAAVNYFEQIRVPVLASASPDFTGALNLKQHDRLPASARTYLSAAAVPLQDRDFLDTVLLPFYQWCFSGQDPDALARHPKLSVEIRNQQEPRHLAEWPAPAVRFTPLYLQHLATDAGAQLSLTPADSSARSTLGEDAGLRAQTFVSPVLRQDVELLGPLLLELHALSSASDTAFRVELLEEVSVRQIQSTPSELPSFLNPDPSPALDVLTATTTTLVSSGQLKASMRQLTTALAPDFQAEYAFTAANRISASTIIRYDIALQPAAYRFRSGNRIVLRIAQTADAALRDRERTDQLVHDSAHPSRLWLPVLPDPTLPLSAPFAPFAILENAPPAAPPPALLPPPEAGAPTIDADALFNSTNPVILVPRR